MAFLRTAALLIVTAYLGGGCVAYEIRDELRTTNVELKQMHAKLDRMSVDLANTNQKLEKSNHSLGVMEESMDPIRVSLRRIDDELAAFRQVIDKVDHYLPINIKPDTAAPARQAPSTETTPQKQ